MNAIQLKELLRDRDDIYHNKTKEIAQKINFVFEAIIEVLEVTPSSVHWEGMDIFEKTLVLVAKVDYEDGAIRLITIGIPLFVIDRGSKEFLLKFLLANKRDDVVDNSSEEDNSIDMNHVTAEPAYTTTKESMREYVERNITDKRTVH